jgi:putative transposase
MAPPAHPARYQNHCLPGEIMRDGAWLSARFTWSDRDVPALLCTRGIAVSHAAIRPWCRTCGQDDAQRLRRRRPPPGDTWHLEAVVLTINGARHALWRAVEQHENILDMLVQRRRHTHAAKQCFRTLLTGCPYVPRVITTATLQSYGAAKRERRPGVEHRQSRYRKNRCAHAHRPTRQRERRMQGCPSPGHAPRFVSAYGPLAQHCRPRRHVLSAVHARQERRQRCASWADMTGTERAASREGKTGEGTRAPEERLSLNHVTKPPGG